ncbi:MAG: site-specific integrase [Alphaproteobacteria bacterium]|nr:site-specific integrase [Alphaproteobacteria bacterium]MCB9791461.1 site-specific integrase [Alphaproteobacteria bacterium]
MAKRKTPWNVRKDHKSNSWIIDFGYRDAAGNARRFRRSAGKGVTKKQAEAKAVALYRKHQRDPIAFVEHLGRSRHGTKAVPFSGVARRYYEEEVIVRLRPATQRTHEQILRVHLYPAFGDKDLRTITARDVTAYQARKRREGKSAKSINNQVGVLSRVFEFAIQQELHNDNPTKHKQVRPLRVDRPTEVWLERTQADSFLAAVAENDPEYWPLFLAALRTGMRQGELLALCWQDVYLDQGLILVRHSMHRGKLGPTKGNKVRRVPIAQDLAEVLAERVGAPEAFVFAQEDGSPLTPNMVKNPHRRARGAIGMPKLRFHDLRHSFASQLVSAAVPFPAIQRLLGHAHVTTTTRYTHMAEDGLRAAVATLTSRSVNGEATHA